MVSRLTIGVVAAASTAWRTLRRWRLHAADVAGDIAFDRGRAAVEHLEEAIATESEPDLVVMAAAYQLTRLLDLDDVAWAWQPGESCVASLDDDATIRGGTREWALHRERLPERVQRALVCGTQHYGWIVMTNRAGRRPVSRPALHAAVELCDRVAACLAAHAHPPISHTR